MIRKIKIWLIRRDIRQWKEALHYATHPGVRQVINAELAHLEQRLAKLEGRA